MLFLPGMAWRPGWDVNPAGNRLGRRPPPPRVSPGPRNCSRALFLLSLQTHAREEIKRAKAVSPCAGREDSWNCRLLQTRCAAFLLLLLLFFSASEREERGVHKLTRSCKEAGHYPRLQGKVRASSRVSQNVQFSRDPARRGPRRHLAPSRRCRAERAAES